VPISAILLAHVILGESLTPGLLVGAMMVIAGVSLNQLTVAGGRIIHSD
jgi:drug/metabolite transporter (DMT)-like permease